MAETNYRMMFAEALAEIDNGSPRGTSECYQFGSTWGCRPDCPVFQRGECELQAENEEMFVKEEINNA